MQTRNHIRHSGTDRVFLAIVYLLLFLFLLVELYPLVFVLSASVSEPSAVASGAMWLFPVRASLKGYQYILGYQEIWTGYLNTILYTVVGTIINLLVTLPAAYALSRRDLKGRNVFMPIFMIPMYFGGGLVATYLNIQSLGLLNTRWVMVLSGALSVFNMIVAKTFFGSTIPWELHEAARVDGASDFTTFLRIVLPLSMPIVVVLCLYYGVGHWNSYFSAMIYLARSRESWPLSLVLREILIRGQFLETVIAGSANLSEEEMLYMIKQADTANMIKYCVIVVSVAPMLAVYPWLQKFFAKGVMIGSVKG